MEVLFQDQTKNSIHVTIIIENYHWIMQFESSLALAIIGYEPL